jgi:glycosyltransferase involved in cell wall biosynthesis
MSKGNHLRIAVLNRHFGKRFGGAEHYSVAVVEQLAKHHEVHVFAQEIEHQLPGVFYHLIARPIRKPRWINQLWYATATWWLTRRGFDIVHSHENTWHGHIQTVHVRPFRTGLFHQRSGWRRWLKWMALFTSPRLLTYWWLERSRMQAKPNRCIVATSASVKEDILQAYPHVSPLLHTIAPGVELPTHASDKVQLRNLLGLPLSPPLALFVGNDYLKKGLPTLLHALVKLPDLHLAVAGQTMHLVTCQQLAQSLGVAQRVHFLGTVSNMASAYDAADLLVHPTTEDTYAMVVLEAMAHGLPVVVSGPHHCGISAELVNGQNASLINDPRNAAEIASALSRVLGNSSFSEKMIKEGFKFSAARTWEKTSNDYLHLFRKIAQPHTRQNQRQFE